MVRKFVSKTGTLQDMGTGKAGKRDIYFIGSGDMLTCHVRSVTVVDLHQQDLVARLPVQIVPLVILAVPDMIQLRCIVWEDSVDSVALLWRECRCVADGNGPLNHTFHERFPGSANVAGPAVSAIPMAGSTLKNSRYDSGAARLDA